MVKSKYTIEIATSDFATTKSAVDGGADRIELCANLVEGGTTPSIGTIKKCRASFQVMLYPIIRPRGGDFLYSKEEYEIMLEDIKICRQIGCDGIVAGILNGDGTIDVKRTSKLINAAYPMEVTFHRAFDRCIDPFAALEQLIDIGCERILTSGQKPAALEGVGLIAALQKQADDRITIMPGSGVRKENINIIADQTGCTEFHASLRNKTESKMQFQHPEFINSEESYMNNSIIGNEVMAMKLSLQSLKQN